MCAHSAVGMLATSTCLLLGVISRAARHAPAPRTYPLLQVCSHCGWDAVTPMPALITAPVVTLSFGIWSNIPYYIIIPMIPPGDLGPHIYSSLSGLRSWSLRSAARESSLTAPGVWRRVCCAIGHHLNRSGGRVCTLAHERDRGFLVRSCMIPSPLNKKCTCRASCSRYVHRYTCRRGYDSW